MSQLDRLVWIDCEMTGLDPEIDELVEIAVIVTDFDLIPVDDGLDLVICPSDGALAQMNDFVRTMHTDSGLLEALPGGDSLETATRTVLDYVKRHVPEPRRVPLAGNTIGTDRAFLARYMPDLDAHLHYRSVDVSTVKELAKRWFPRAYFRAPEKRGGHRALHDIQESIRELRYYREAVFVPIPGPTSEELQAVTDRLTPGF